MVETQQVFRALADPTRRAIFERLCRDGDTTVGTLTDGAGVSQPVVSKHLRVLKQAGLVDGRPDGRQTHYRAKAGGLDPLKNWAGRMESFWERRVDALESLLNRMDQ